MGEMYLSRKSFAFNSDKPGAGLQENRDSFERALKTVDASFQNLDSSEISLTDVSHYFDSDPTKLAEKFSGKKVSSYVADTTTANGQVRTLAETTRLDARTKLLNPKWYEGNLAAGYLEANGRGYWDTSEENIERLKTLYQEAEDKL